MSTQTLNTKFIASLFITAKSEVVQSCLTLYDSMDCSLLGSSVRGIFQARVLEWVAISFSRGIIAKRCKQINVHQQTNE